jgi:hypothetical protein
MAFTYSYMCYVKDYKPWLETWYKETMCCMTQSRSQEKSRESLRRERVCTTDSNQAHTEYKSRMEYSYRTEKGMFSSAPGLIDFRSPKFFVVRDAGHVHTMRVGRS